jgi:hypothetical protein
VQVVSSPWKVPPAVAQSAAVTSLQVPEASAMQQAPVGWGHRLGVQVVPEPW